jgi:hypothetical protein
MAVANSKVKNALICAFLFSIHFSSTVSRSLAWPSGKSDGQIACYKHTALGSPTLEWRKSKSDHIKECRHSSILPGTVCVAFDYMTQILYLKFGEIVKGQSDGVYTCVSASQFGTKRFRYNVTVRASRLSVPTVTNEKTATARSPSASPAEKTAHSQSSTSLATNVISTGEPSKPTAEPTGYTTKQETVSKSPDENNTSPIIISHNCPITLAALAIAVVSILVVVLTILLYCRHRSSKQAGF